MIEKFEVFYYAYFFIFLENNFGISLEEKTKIIPIYKIYQNKVKKSEKKKLKLILAII